MLSSGENFSGSLGTSPSTILYMTAIKLFPSKAWVRVHISYKIQPIDLWKTTSLSKSYWCYENYEYCGPVNHKMLLQGQNNISFHLHFINIYNAVHFKVLWIGESQLYLTLLYSLNFILIILKLKKKRLNEIEQLVIVLCLDSKLINLLMI